MDCVKWPVPCEFLDSQSFRVPCGSFLRMGLDRESWSNPQSEPDMSSRLEIVILEDNLDRRVAMRDCLTERFPQFTVRFFVTAGETIAFLHGNLARVIAIALDHDLDLIPVHPRRTLDPGTGRDVVDFLATQSPVCPVLIHSTNVSAVTGMRRELEESGWKTYRVIPTDGEAWIGNDWIIQLRNAIVESVDGLGAQTPEPDSRDSARELWAGAAHESIVLSPVAQP